MRHKYDTRGIILARTPAGEAHAGLAILTPDLGLVRARAAGIRHAKSKLAHALVTLAESDLTLVAGREGWRVAGAVLAKNWFVALATPSARRRAARVTGLLLRLAPDDVADTELFPTLCRFFGALEDRSEATDEGAELLAAASVLSALGLNREREASATPSFAPAELLQVLTERDEYIARINRGIAASGL
jgi:recombinational DNA repair protein (RecF pathway)